MKSQKKYSKIISCILAVMMIVCIFAACTNPVSYAQTRPMSRATPIAAQKLMEHLVSGSRRTR